jgi:hypothetical protein
MLVNLPVTFRGPLVALLLGSVFALFRPVPLHSAQSWVFCAQQLCQGKASGFAVRGVGHTTPLGNSEHPKKVLVSAEDPPHDT